MRPFPLERRLRNDSETTARREAVARDIQADAKKYVDEAVPLVRDRALRLAPASIGSVLEEKFTEDELRQIASALESPAFAKFQQLGNEMQQAFIDKLLADTQPTIEPKVKVLEQSIARRLGITAPPAQARSHFSQYEDLLRACAQGMGWKDSGTRLP
mgnify:CR=1 FL=1